MEDIVHFNVFLTDLTVASYRFTRRFVTPEVSSVIEYQESAGPHRPPASRHAFCFAISQSSPTRYCDDE
jgi:hypothetical protein